MPCAPRTIEALNRSGSAEEALARLDGLHESSAACLRGFLHLELLHIDQGIEALEGLVADEPSYAPAWARLQKAYCDAERSSDLQRCTQALRTLPRCENSFVDVKRYAREHSGSQGLEELVAAVQRQDRVMPYHLAELFWIATRRGSPEVALPLIQRVPCGEWREWLACTPDEGMPPAALPGTLLFFKSLSRREHLSDSLDEFLRQAWLCWSQTHDGDRWRWCLRTGLEADPEFRRGPAAPYLLSLLCDPHLECRTAGMLRREAYAAGFRGRGLLEDLARSGEPVMEELAAVDDVTADLVAAIRSEGAVALRRFLDRDDAWRDQREEAAWALRRRGAWEALHAHRLAQPAAERMAMIFAPSIEDKRAHLRRYLEMRTRDAPGIVLGTLADMIKDDKDGFAHLVIEALGRGRMCGRMGQGVRPLEPTRPDPWIHVRQQRARVP